MNLDRFNDKQKEAILTTDGPILILAGAGSGKTTVVVNKIAYILEQALARPYEILAITFTNKAANEMKERIEGLIGEAADGMWIHTFHACCMKILRKNIHLLGYSSDFVIYDTADQKTLVKRCLKELDMDEKYFPVKGVMAEISSAKDDLMEPDSFCEVFEGDFRKSKVGEVYKLYQKRLKEANALDFDDIIMLSVKVLSMEEEALKYYQNKFKYIFVDEYQDTNNSQYMLTSMLAAGRENICVVGDDDQSIYKFRGANINNILDFEKEFSGAKLIKLEQNYRSTQNILNAANHVIANNMGRKGKNLWTDNGDGEKIDVFGAPNEYEEAEYIAKQINLATANGGKYSDCAILYRTNAQSRIIETTLSGYNIPYRVLAGLRFYDRKEVKDVLAYLRLVYNPNDNISLIRVVNEPSRKIGTTSIEKIAQVASEREISMFAAMEMAEEIPDLVKISDKLKGFTTLIRNIQAMSKEALPSAILENILELSGYRAMLMLDASVENQTRLENIGEFISSAFEYEKDADEPTLAEFLERTSLVSDIDNYDENADTVVLMTLHSAKGLEFGNVFLCGMEEGLFPSSRSMFSSEEIEEERRLCYVGITRAKKHLTISYALRRNLYGGSQYSNPSRFLGEIPEEFTNVIAQKNETAHEIDSSSKPSKQALFNDIFNKKAFDVRSKPVNVDFAPGDVVTHRKFGKGMILSVTPEGNDVRIEIAFDDAGTKNLMGAFAKLTKV
ncbi:MAG: UvrD-helicase domain-containing protein [Clostridia bacterium]|nr:UvrD-helicase domain-containing protein [Clostridia bacterium]